MGGEWTTRQLKDCADWYSGGTPRKSVPEYWDGDIPWISAKSLNEFFVCDSEDKVTESAIGNGTRLVPEKSILFVVRGMSLKTEFRLGIATRPVTFNQDVKALVAKDDIDPDFLVYAIKAKTDDILASVEEAGHGTGVLPTSIVQSIQIGVPDLKEQKRISSICRSLDDKIELNRKMNETLEAMAQALFKSWFVDFDPVIDNALKAGKPIPEALAQKAAARKALGRDRPSLPEEIQGLFPSEFVRSEEMGWIPGGWEFSDLNDVTSLIIDHRGKTPKKIGGDWQGSGYAAISAKNIKDRKLIRKDAIKYVDSDLYSRWMQDELQAGDVLMTSEAPLGETYYLSRDEKWVLSQRLFGIRAKKEVMNGIFLFHWLNTEIAVADIQGRASGTTVQGIKQSELRKVIVLCPPLVCLTIFSEYLLPLMDKLKSNEDIMDELQMLRDVLLPQLLSGRLIHCDCSC